MKHTKVALFYVGGQFVFYHELYYNALANPVTFAHLGELLYHYVYYMALRRTLRGS